VLHLVVGIYISTPVDEGLGNGRLSADRGFNQQCAVIILP
jgi:hypothetical protein